MDEIKNMLPNTPTNQHVDLEARERQLIKESQKELKETRQKFADQASVWSGDQPLKFTFSDWQPEKQKNVQVARNVGNRAYKLAKEEIKQLQSGEPFNVMLVGRAGVGKTSLALAMAEMIAEAGFTKCFVNTSELSNLILDRISSAGNRSRQYEIDQQLDFTEHEMKIADVLILDDFGTEGSVGRTIHSVNATMQNRIYRVANARIDLQHNHISKPTIITTNNTGQEIEQLYDTKTVSRLIPKDKKYWIVFNGFRDVRGTR